MDCRAVTGASSRLSTWSSLAAEIRSGLAVRRSGGTWPVVRVPVESLQSHTSAAVGGNHPVRTAPVLAARDAAAASSLRLKAAEDKVHEVRHQIIQIQRTLITGRMLQSERLLVRLSAQEEEKIIFQASAKADYARLQAAYVSMLVAVVPAPLPPAPPTTLPADGIDD
mmetsp:Transcript_32060/g.79916  ORF Transcript_32060/g.79916 Transcript_32060/m.79916 type:complete len:168 (+) Transcript_32060:806-1309(+)